MTELGVDLSPLKDRMRELQDEGRTVSWVADVTASPRLSGLLAFGDTVKPSAREAIDALKAQGVGVALLTGDNTGSAALVARELGIAEVHAEVLPADKARIVTTKVPQLWDFHAYQLLGLPRRPSLALPFRRPNVLKSPSPLLSHPLLRL